MKSGELRSGRWTAAELATLRRLYPDVQTAEIARRLKRKTWSVYQRAYHLGLKKSPEYLASLPACRLRPGSGVGSASRFYKGQVPPNKGLRRPGWGPGRMKETQFKKGRAPHEASNYLPIGSERLTEDGYLERKVTDDPSVYPARRWVAVHRLVWEEARGPVPAGCVVVFKSADKLNTAIGNLECITRRELMSRNTVHNLPKPVVHAIQMLGALKRQIRRKETVHVAHD